MSAALASKAVSIVLVHGGFVDGSGWEGVYKILKKDGYRVSIVQNPTISLEDDVAVTKRTLAAQPGPVILVGHSYGGVVITEAGNDPKVVGLVYIAAFAPDRGESVSALIKDPPPGAPVPPILPAQDGFLFLDSAKFAASFAADVDPRNGPVHGRLAGALGRQRARWSHQRTGVEVEAELVPHRDRRQDDSAAGSAVHVEARGRDRGRGQRQPFGLRLTTEGRGQADRRRCDAGGIEWSAAPGSRSVTDESKAPSGVALTVVIVHGAWVDGTGWREVIALLQTRGLKVVAVQNPLSSLADDVDTVTRAIDHQSSPVVLVGQGYGGTVITQAGSHAKVVALVYVAAFAPEERESTSDVQKDYPPPPCVVRFEIDAGGFLYFEQDAVPEFLAQDLPAADGRILAAAQKPIRASALADRVASAAWHEKPCWYRGDR